MRWVCAQSGNGHISRQLVRASKPQDNGGKSLSEDTHQAIPAWECILRTELRMWTKILQQDLYCDIVYCKESYLETFGSLFLRDRLNCVAAIQWNIM